MQAVPLDLGDWQLVTVDSGATHSIAASGYNERRAECRAACEPLGVATLRDADDLDGLPDAAAPARPPRDHRERPRRRHRRRRSTAGDLEAVGALLDASHASLRDDYEASVPEVEATVSA